MQAHVNLVVKLLLVHDFLALAGHVVEAVASAF